MSRRRKNAGKGFGFMFHGAFANKKSAKRKEKQVHGFIQPRNIKGQRRFVVMSERKNPIRRKKKGQRLREIGDRDARAGKPIEAYYELPGHKHESDRAAYEIGYRAAKDEMRKKKNTYIPGSNPMDLVVMGANPKRNPEKEIVVEPGQTITFKFNPDTHVAEEVREGFVGEPPNKITIYHEPHMRDGEYASLGQLVGISFKPVHGGQVQAVGYYKGAERIPLLEAAKKMLPLIEAPTLVSDDVVTFFQPWPKRLFFVGGVQDISPMLDEGKHKLRGEDLWELGECRHIVYRERKWFDKFQLINYVHPFGEETGDKPTLYYNARMKRLLVGGGDYSIKPEGITN